jgi:hypothetical protein
MLFFLCLYVIIILKLGTCKMFVGCGVVVVVVKTAKKRINIGIFTDLQGCISTTKKRIFEIKIYIDVIFALKTC